MMKAIENSDFGQIQAINMQMIALKNAPPKPPSQPASNPYTVTAPSPHVSKFTPPPHAAPHAPPSVTSPVPSAATFNPYANVSKARPTSKSEYTPRPQPGSLRNPPLSNYQLNAVLRKQPPLYDLAKRGDSYTLRQRLVELGPHAPKVLNTPHRQFGSTPMHGAAWFIQHEAVRLLIEFGALINIPNKKGYTAYQEASMGSNFDRSMKAFFDSKLAYDQRQRTAAAPQPRRQVSAPVPNSFSYGGGTASSTPSWNGPGSTYGGAMHGHGGSTHGGAMHGHGGSTHGHGGSAY